MDNDSIEEEDKKNYYNVQIIKSSIVYNHFSLKRPDEKRFSTDIQAQR